MYFFSVCVCVCVCVCVSVFICIYNSLSNFVFLSLSCIQTLSFFLSKKHTFSLPPTQPNTSSLKTLSNPLTLFFSFSQCTQTHSFSHSPTQPNTTLPLSPTHPNTPPPGNHRYSRSTSRYDGQVFTTIFPLGANGKLLNIVLDQAKINTLTAKIEKLQLG